MSSSQANVRQSSSDPLIGRIINERFRVITLLARGGMGRVYKAEQLPLGRQVALKVLHRPPSNEGDQQFEARFLVEASTAAKLRHSNTVTVFDYGRTPDGICFIAMELVEGQSLLEAIRRGAPFSAERTVHIALQIARSLREAHEFEVIHRDLKPANVLLSRHDDDRDFVKVLDFGLVKHTDGAEKEGLTREGLFLGSPRYMAPEQIVGERIDIRADVYALGVCMYEMLSGRVPFNHENTVKILMAHMHEEAAPLPSSCPTALAEVVTRCLSKNPAGRPASMDELIIALKTAIGSDLPRSGEQSALFLKEGTSLQVRLSADSGFHAPLSSPGAETSASSIRPGSTSLSPGQGQLGPIGGFGGASSSGAPVEAGWGARPKPLARIAVFATMILAGAIFGLTSVRSTRQTQVPSLAPQSGTGSTEKAPDRPTTTAAVPAEKAADTGESAHILVNLSSTPSGAMVAFEGRLYGPTPASIELDGAGVAVGNEVTFVFEKEGYEPVRITRRVKSQDLRVEAQLSPPSSSSEGRSRTRSQSNATSGVSAAPTVDTPSASAQLDQVPSPKPGSTTSATSTQPPAPPESSSHGVAAAKSAPVAAQATAPAPSPTLAKPSKLIANGSAVPEYPRSARRAGIAGVVVARIHVKPDGLVGRVEILDGPSVFHESVRVALESRRYEPARLSNGMAVADTHVIRVPFELK